MESTLAGIRVVEQGQFITGDVRRDRMRLADPARQASSQVESPEGTITAPTRAPRTRPHFGTTAQAPPVALNEADRWICGALPGLSESDV